MMFLKNFYNLWKKQKFVKNYTQVINKVINISTENLLNLWKTSCFLYFEQYRCSHFLRYCLF